MTKDKVTKIDNLAESLEVELGAYFSELTHQKGLVNELTLECGVQQQYSLLSQLRDHKLFQFDELVDLCGVDYLSYGNYDWETESATSSGFSRGVEKQSSKAFPFDKPRFAVVYHLLSTTLNHRVRVRVFLDEEHLIIPSVTPLWKAANWFEREAYDLFGILFEGHQDLRRILTDYGFIGHPFRKDFPVSGQVEMRYDATTRKVIYEPVSIQPRILVPKVIREDNRYLESQGSKE